MNLDKKYEDLVLNVSIKAALASYYFIGKNDKISYHNSNRNIYNSTSVFDKFTEGIKNKTNPSSLNERPTNHIS